MEGRMYFQGLPGGNLSHSLFPPLFGNTVSATDNTTSTFGSKNYPRYSKHQNSPRSPLDLRPAGRDEEVAEVYIKREKDLDDEPMRTPATSPGPDHRAKKLRTHSSSLPNLTSPFCPTLDLRSHDDVNHQTQRCMPDSRGEVHDEDRMSIQQESHSMIQSRERENGDTESVSTVVTIRNLRRSPSTQEGVQDSEGEFDVARTAEYQSALFGMLEEICTDAARRYWRDVASQRRFCLPIRATDSRFQHARSYTDGYSYGSYPPPIQPIRTNQSNNRLNRRHRVDPYPLCESDSRPYNRSMRHRIFDYPFYRESPLGEDTRMSLSPPESTVEEIGNTLQPLRFLVLISRITNHLWTTERSHAAAPHRAEFLTARKCWDIWRTAEVVVNARDAESGHDPVSETTTIRGRDEVIGIVEAAGELCGILGDDEGRTRCEELVLGWILDDVGEEIEEGEIVE